MIDRETARIVQKRGGGTASANLLLLAGFVILGVGMALALGQRYLPEVAWYARILAEVGVTSAPVAMGGLVLMGLGMVGRIQVRLHRRGERSAGFGELSAQVSTQGDELRRACTTLAELCESNATTRQQVEAFLEAQGTLEEAAVGQRQEHRDAVFRLAASLDQVGAKVDKRIQERMTVLEEKIATRGSTDGSSGGSTAELEALADGLARMENQIGNAVFGIQEQVETLESSLARLETRLEAIVDARTTLATTTPAGAGSAQPTPPPAPPVPMRKAIEPEELTLELLDKIALTVDGLEPASMAVEKPQAEPDSPPPLRLVKPTTTTEPVPPLPAPMRPTAAEDTTETLRAALGHVLGESE